MSPHIAALCSSEGSRAETLMRMFACMSAVYHNQLVRVGIMAASEVSY